MEELERKLPIISVVEGVDFYVDAFKGELIDTKDINNIIYKSDMLPLEDHFEMLFDKSARNIKETEWEGTASDERYQYVWLRRLEVYDPVGAKQSATNEQLLKFNTLPVIDIEGVKFLWDRQHTLLRQQNNPWNAIYKNDMIVRSGTEGFYFDKQRNLVPFSHELPPEKQGLPDHIKFVPKAVLNEKIRHAEHSKISQVLPPVEGKKLKLRR